MKTSSIWDLRSIVGKIMMGLVLTVMVGSVDVVPALGEDDHGRGRYEQKGRGHDRARYEHGRHVYRTYDYRDRYYAPPPVVYAPPPAPGISIFLPIHR